MQPIGTLNIPLSSSVRGASVQTISSNLTLPTSLAQALNFSLVITDDFARTFTYPLQITTTYSTSYSYSKLATYPFIDNIFFLKDDKNFGFGIKKNNSKYSIFYDDESLFGISGAGAFAIDSAKTYYFNYEYNSEAFKYFLTYGYGNAKSSSTSLITHISYVQALGGGVEYKLNNLTANLNIPTKVIKGNMNLHLPYARDYEGNIYYDEKHVDLSSGKTSYELNLAYALSKNLKLFTNLNFNTLVNSEFYGFKYESLF